MATTVTFAPPCDHEQDFTAWFAGKGYTVEDAIEQHAGGGCWRVTLTEDLDAAQKTQLTTDIREELVYPVTFS